MATCDKMSFFSIITSGWALPVAVLLAALIKVISPSLCFQISILSTGFDSICQFIVMPLVFINVIFSVSSIAQNHQKLSKISKFFLITVFFAIIIYILALLISFLFKTHNLITDSKSVKDLLSGTCVISQVSFDQVLQKINTTSLTQFITESIPSNIFSSLSSGRWIHIILSAILIGSSIGYFSSKIRIKLSSFLHISYEIFQRLGEWINPLLVFGLFCDVCHAFSRMTNVGALLTVWKYILVCWISFFILIILSMAFISLNLKISFMTLFKSIRRHLLLVFSTNEEFLASPFFIKMTKTMPHIDTNALNVLLPASLSLFSFGNIFYYTIATFTSIKIYGFSFSFESYILFCIVIVFCSMSKDPIGKILISIFVHGSIPSHFSTTFFPIIDWMIQPLRSVLSFVLSAACSSYVAKIQSDSKDKEGDHFSVDTPLFKMTTKE